ncbi:GntR family transcriptional regulator [Amycolatopsis sp. NPDC005232]|uniref:GntR family transcriptional regulator n=1 Tax=Amycolatopsis sp. NPDC005232 TaxID=3157027 RepID=UPI0033B2B679
MSLERHAAPLRQQVVRQLRGEILDGVRKPGERLVETALCEAYDVSRTVVREALRQLETESLITMRPNRGPIVTVLTPEDIEALYEVRQNLEGLAGEKFAQRASESDAEALVAQLDHMESTFLAGDVTTRGREKDEFYRLLLLGAHNPVLADQLRGIHSRISIFRHFAFVDDRRAELSLREVRAIVTAAAVRRDPAEARRACEEHIRLAGELAIVEYETRREGGTVAV